MALGLGRGGSGRWHSEGLASLDRRPALAPAIKGHHFVAIALAGLKTVVEQKQLAVAALGLSQVIELYQPPEGRVVPAVGAVLFGVEALSVDAEPGQIGQLAAVLIAAGQTPAEQQSIALLVQGHLRCGRWQRLRQGQHRSLGAAAGQQNQRQKHQNPKDGA